MLPPQKRVQTLLLYRSSPHFLCFIIPNLLPLHLVASSTAVCVSSEHVAELEDIKHVVHLLHTALHQPEHHLLKERQLLERLDELNQQLSPLEKVDDMLWRVYVVNGQVNHPSFFF